MTRGGDGLDPETGYAGFDSPPAPPLRITNGDGSICTFDFRTGILSCRFKRPTIHDGYVRVSSDFLASMEEARRLAEEALRQMRGLPPLDSP